MPLIKLKSNIKKYNYQTFLLSYHELEIDYTVKQIVIFLKSFTKLCF